MEELKPILNLDEFTPDLDFEAQVLETNNREIELLKKDYKELKKEEKEIKTEEEIVKDFEKKIVSLLKTLTYLEGYIAKIEEGDTLLKKHPSVERLGNELSLEIEEIEALSKSLRSEEQKSLTLAKHIRQTLDKAKKYHEMIFEDI